MSAAGAIAAAVMVWTAQDALRAAEVCEAALAPIHDVRGHRGPRTLPQRRARCRAYVTHAARYGVPRELTAALGWAETRWGTDDDDTGRSGCCHGPVQVSLRWHRAEACRGVSGPCGVRLVAVRTLARLWHEEGDAYRVAGRWNGGPAWERKPHTRRWAAHVERVTKSVSVWRYAIRAVCHFATRHGDKKCHSRRVLPERTRGPIAAGPSQGGGRAAGTARAPAFAQKLRSFGAPRTLRQLLE